MARTKTKWEKNLEKVKRAQERAHELISDLESKGFTVSENIKKMVERPLKSRYTSKEADYYKSLTNANRIKSYSVKDGIKASQRNITIIKQAAYKENQNVQYLPRFQEKIKVRKGRETEDLARAYFRHAKFAINKHPSADVDIMLFQMFRMLKSVGLVSKSAKLRRGQMKKYLNSIRQDDFVKAYQKYINISVDNKDDAEGAMRVFYQLGRSSEKAYKSSLDIAFESAKQTFAGRFEVTYDKADKIYNFFKDSVAWNEFKKKYLDSDQEEYADITYEIAETAEKIGVNKMDSILMSATSLDEVLRKN